MRIIAGRAGGLRLVAPRGDRTRPTSDRTREAVFNSLGSLGLIDQATVLDLYCGSGAMGVEALSRGALSATFVDDSPAAIEAVRANLATASLGDAAEVRRGDVNAELLGGLSERRYDLVFVDPPYDFDDWSDLLPLLGGAVVVIESDRTIDPGPDREVLRQRRYGSTVVTIAGPADPDRIVRPTSEDRS